MSKNAVEKKIKPVKIMIFGTFDGIHKGHMNFFKQARDLSKTPYLIVSIARDKNVKKIKGKSPIKNEKEREELVRKIKIVDKVILSGLTNHIPHIVKETPDIIALGYDQVEYIKNLKKDLKEKKLSPKIIRLKPYKEHIYKNTLLKKLATK